VLQDRRLELGHDLDQVAKTLRIRRPYLEAIENSRWNDLPGGAYVTGFLRSYADFLGVDSAEVLERFKLQMAGDVKQVELYFPEPVNENRLPTMWLVVAGLVVAVIAYGGWYASSYMPASGEGVPSLPGRLVDLIHGQAPPPAQTATTAVGAGEMTALLDASRAASVGPDAAGQTAPQKLAAAPQAGTTAGTAAGAAPAAEGAEETEAPQVPDINPASPEGGTQQVAAAKPAAPPTPEGPRTYGEEGQTRISIRAVEESWIQVKDKEGRVLTSRLLRAGDVYKVPNLAGLRLLTGNAGGTRLSLDGTELAPLGDANQVLRDVSLDPAALQVR
jgi:cytoskeleton protein RodZ